ncbi:RNAse G [Pelagirhabdus alkalitolerans]|uniref:RNAse G n=1 Tax=Pelagirhabdus alkalitolerans TaxID=1612202 RepID=A0A1G6HPH7_9BACI|nr:ribonuclease E/G [Pelagirhabdus alkalitolerans]SDB96094.1 RNAse G [Pelagirhabdus alkalitolerans]
MGSIFIGKVETVDKGLQAAFVDIGGDKLAYLEKREIPTTDVSQDKPIESLITEGQSIIVQVTKDAYKEKGARLTHNITLGDSGIVYMPRAGYVAISKKIDAEKKDELKANIQSLLENEEGAIIRTKAEHYTNDELRIQIEALRDEWKSIEHAFKNGRIGQTLYYDDPIYNRFIRRFTSEGIEKIYCDDATAIASIKKKYPQLQAEMKWLPDCEAHLPQSIDQVYSHILKPVVELENGVSIQIESTEALTAIDVNSSGFTGKKRSNRIAYDVNRIAARQIMRELRLRNISGMVVIDFIRMKNKKDQSNLLHELRKWAKEDLTRIDLFGFTALGLFELTRKREAPVHEFILKPATLEKKPSLHTLSFQLEREIHNQNAEAVVVEVSKRFKQTWNQVIHSESFYDLSQPTVYFIESKGVESYAIRRVGSDTLVNDYLRKKDPQLIDKLNPDMV